MIILSQANQSLTSMNDKNLDKDVMLMPENRRESFGGRTLVMSVNRGGLRQGTKIPRTTILSNIGLYDRMAPTWPFTVSKVSYLKSHCKPEEFCFGSVENGGEY
ncbi:hypothetical protein GQX74_010901 [Glossina fuscipes]|nr:hypothetical protein GQX74_010901 [Glossina fuscipes]